MIYFCEKRGPGAVCTLTPMTMHGVDYLVCRYCGEAIKEKR